MVYRSFLTGRALASVETAMERSWVTLQEFYAPPVITIRRRDPNTGVKSNVAIVTPIKIDLNSGFGGSIAGEPVTEVTNGGTVRLHTPIDVKIGDWFMLGNDRYTIGFVDDENANHGAIVVNVTVGEGN